MSDALDAMHGGARGSTKSANGSEAAIPGPSRFLEGVVPRQRFRAIKFSYAAAGARRQRIGGLLVGELQPEPGDIVLARVEELGQHHRLELWSGRRARMFPEDEIVLAYGNRYAPDAFEAEIPHDLSPCHLVAAGGIASRMVSRHVNFSEPTEITPIGLLARPDGRRLNLTDWGLGPPPPAEQQPLSIAVIGSAMNAGKTTAAANLVKGLAQAGWRVGAAKVTGTGAGGDVWFLTDAGADPVYDFTSVGLPSTYRAGSASIERALTQLHGHLAAAGVDAMVLEVADGMYQSETAELLRSEAFSRRVDGVIFAANDALSAVAAVDQVRELDLPLVAISGRVTASPLAARETAEATGLPVIDMVGLRDPGELLSVMRERRQPMAGVSLVPSAATAG